MAPEETLADADDFGGRESDDDRDDGEEHHRAALQGTQARPDEEKGPPEHQGGTGPHRIDKPRRGGHVDAEHPTPIQQNARSAEAHPILSP